MKQKIMKPTLLILVLLLILNISLSATLEDNTQSPFSDTNNELTIENMNTIWNKIRYFNFIDEMIDMSGKNITNVGHISTTTLTPPDNNHLVTKEYVDTVAGVGATGGTTGTYMCYTECADSPFDVECHSQYNQELSYANEHPSPVIINIGNKIVGHCTSNTNHRTECTIEYEGSTSVSSDYYYSNGGAGSSICLICCQPSNNGW